MFSHIKTYFFSCIVFLYMYVLFYSLLSSPLLINFVTFIFITKIKLHIILEICKSIKFFTFWKIPRVKISKWENPICIVVTEFSQSITELLSIDFKLICKTMRTVWWELLIYWCFTNLRYNQNFRLTLNWRQQK